MLTQCFMNGCDPCVNVMENFDVNLWNMSLQIYMQINFTMECIV